MLRGAAPIQHHHRRANLSEAGYLAFLRAIKRLQDVARFIVENRVSLHAIRIGSRAGNRGQSREKKRRQNDGTKTGEHGPHTLGKKSRLAIRNLARGNSRKPSAVHESQRSVIVAQRNGPVLQVSCRDMAPEWRRNLEGCRPLHPVATVGLRTGPLGDGSRSRRQGPGALQGRFFARFLFPESSSSFPNCIWERACPRTCVAGAVESPAQLGWQ